MNSIIEFKEVTIGFNGKIFLENVNLTIHENKILGLVGRSGSGKTTLFRLFLGVYCPNNGKILYKGKKVDKKIKEKVGFASQENSFYPRLTVEENIAYFGSMYNLPVKEIKIRADRLLELMALESARKTRANNLSGGMKRRLDLAIALVHDPDVLILDEPTDGFSQEQLDRLKVLMEEIKIPQIIIVSHEPQIEAFVDNIIRLEKVGHETKVI